MEETKTEESKYIQQHLANERTYLAWIRTSIAIIGIGFLVASLHFNTDIGYQTGDFIVVMICLFSLLTGFITILLSTAMYYRNRKDINNQTFRSSHLIVIVVTIIMFLLLGFFISYLVFI